MSNSVIFRTIVILVALFSLSACLQPQPEKTNDLCGIFTQYEDWYTAAKKNE